MLILGPNCHCFCVRSGSVSGSLVAVQSQGVWWLCRAFLCTGTLLSAGMARLAVCPAPGELQLSWLLAGWQTLGCLPRGLWLSLQCWMCVIPGAVGEAGGAECVPWGAVLPWHCSGTCTCLCVHKAVLQPGILSCGTWISSPALSCECQHCTGAAGCL